MHNLGDTVAMAGGLYELDRIKEEWNGTYGWVGISDVLSVLDMPMVPWPALYIAKISRLR